MNDAARIRELEREIAALPPGYISRKNIRGKVCCYYQWREDGKLKSRYLKEGELEPLEEQIARRRSLQKELKQASKADGAGRHPQSRFACYVLTGPALAAFADGVRDWKLRDGFPALEQYLYGPYRDRVFLFSGLQRTGKTTMMRQAIARMSPENVRDCAYLKAAPSDQMDMLNHDLEILSSLGYRYVFLDEVTLAENFIDSAALFSDVYAAQGMKLVLSGKDSLGFWLALHEELYDRAYTVHTTYIPFREHSRLLGSRDLDDYIRYGGTLRPKESGSEDRVSNAAEVPFQDEKSTRRYIDTAISRNIQHSLACYQGGTHFRHLRDLYYADALVDAISWVVGRMNQAFLLNVLTRQESGECNLCGAIDIETVTAHLREHLAVREQEMRRLGVSPTQEKEIQEYLKALDLYVDCPMETTDPNTEPVEYSLFTQPGMRYCQTEVLVQELLQDKCFASVPEREKKMASDRILEEVRGRMMEDIVLLETVKAAKAHQKVFRLQLARGDYDMVVYDGQRNCCAVYEIQHSTQIVPEQRRHLTDAEMLAQTEHRFGPVVGRWVLYRGPSLSTLEDGVSYRNVEEYLETLPEIAFEMPGRTQDQSNETSPRQA